MLSVTMDEVIVQSITLYDNDYPKGYTEPYSEVEHDQIQAFEALSCICEEEHVVTSLNATEEKLEDDTLSGLIGPKRLEITLRTTGMTGDTKLVVTDVMPPSGHYSSYSVAGRLWRNKILERVISTKWSSSCWLARIDAFLGGMGGSATDHFTPQNQEQAWATLEKMFYKFKPAELTVVKNWTPADQDDDDDWGYGGEWYGPAHRSQHWTNRTPSTYAPKEAHFRVAGDEVGAVIHKEQLKTWEEEGSPNPEQSLKEMLEAKAEKKAEAGSTSDGGASGGGTTTPASDDGCADCGSTSCPPHMCEQDFGIGTGGGIPIDGSYTIH